MYRRVDIKVFALFTYYIVNLHLFSKVEEPPPSRDADCDGDRIPRYGGKHSVFIFDRYVCFLFTLVTVTTLQPHQPTLEQDFVSGCMHVKCLNK